MDAAGQKLSENRNGVAEAVRDFGSEPVCRHLDVRIESRMNADIGHKAPSFVHMYSECQRSSELVLRCLPRIGKNVVVDVEASKLVRILSENVGSESQS